jgi:hypothetical protein
MTGGLMTKRTDEGTNATPPAAPATKRVRHIPEHLPEDSVLSIAGVEICKAGEKLSPEEIDRRFALAEARIFGMLPRMYEELGITPPGEPSPESDDE